MRTENKGFTLVELLVSITVMAILGVGIGGFIYVSMRQYDASASEVNLSYEAQAAQNKIQDMLIDASCGVSVSSSPDTVCSIYDYDETGRRIQIEIKYAPSEARLLYTRYYLEETVTPTGSVKAWKVDGDAKEECLASYVTGFDVTLYDEDGNPITGPDSGDVIAKAVIKLSYQTGRKSYSSENTVTLRNRAVESRKPDVLFH